MELASSSDDDLEEEDEDEEPLKVFFCSRTHSQLSQFVGELQHTEFGTTLQSVSLGSRKTLCINPGEEQSWNNQLFCSYALILKIILAVTVITSIFPTCG